MTYWIRWQPAGGMKGPRIGPFADLREAETARLNQTRAAAEAMEFGVGKAGDWTSDGKIWRGDTIERFLGRYVIESEE
jgi:hypothetical protein